MATLKEVKELPSRRFKKKSKYDPVLDKFLESGIPLAIVRFPDTTTKYLSVQLKKRTNKYYPEIKVNVRNGEVYLQSLK